MRLACAAAIIAAGFVGAPATAAAQEPAPLESVWILGTPTVGATLTAVLVPSDAPEPAFQWLRCAADDASSCTEPVGNAATYAVVAADYGHRLRVLATRDGVTVASPLTGPVPSVPALLTGLSIGGSAIVGHTLTAQASVTGVPTPTVSYQWLHCAPGTVAGRCPPIPGATGSSYDVGWSDAGQVIGVRVAAVNAGGADDAWALTPVVLSVSSTVAGVPIVGETLTSQVTSTGNPIPSLGHQWLRCAAPDTCAPIQGATGSSYVIAAADAGQMLALNATATNLVGMALSTSAPTAVVQARPSLSRVSIVGTAVVGETVTADFTVDGLPAPAVTYRWLRCGDQCSEIAGATGPAYDVATRDVGARLALRVTASNSAGEAVRESDATRVVPEPAGRPNFDESGSTPVTTPQTPTATAPSAAGVRSPRYLRPFPVVRLKGRLVPGGARVTLLGVTAPRGSTVVVSCEQGGCPLQRRSVGRGRIRTLERFLRAGVRITVRISKPGLVGKHVRIVIRDGRLPSRRDSCLLPGKKRPAACPRL